jgi:hypothetical protein
MSPPTADFRGAECSVVDARVVDDATVEICFRMKASHAEGERRCRRRGSCAIGVGESLSANRRNSP